MDTETKVCLHCKKPKPLDEFGVHKELDLSGNPPTQLPLQSMRCKLPSEGLRPLHLGYLRGLADFWSIKQNWSQP